MPALFPQICGTLITAQKRGEDMNENDKGGFLWGLLGFCIPLVGLILFLVWKDSKPKTAKTAGIGALVSVIIAVVFYILAAVLGIGAAVALGMVI